MARPPKWRHAFLDRWRSASTADGISRDSRRSLLTELADHLEIEEDGVQLLERFDVPAVVSTVLSLIDGKPVGSRQRNNAELVNTFLQPDRRRPFGRLLKHFIRAFPEQRLMQRPGVQKALERAFKVDQVGRTHLVGKVVLSLFPEYFDDPA